MTLRLVGAGLPRTGTSSLREALGHVFGRPVYHMSEALAHPEHAPVWVAAIKGHPPVWGDFLTGYAAGVDMPFATCWRSLAAVNPDSLVLLSHRGSAEVWYRSMASTVLVRTRAMLAKADGTDPLVPLFRVLFDGIFTDLDDPEDVKAGYERHLEQVRAEIDPGCLIEWQPGDGWEPICRGLNAPVPNRPFPHLNSTADYLARAAARARTATE